MKAADSQILPANARNRKNFTLVELLIVIAIIAILAAMLLPALAKARATARSSHCISNMKQLYLCENNYMSDFNGWLPYCGKGVKLENYTFASKTIASDTVKGPAILLYTGYVAQPKAVLCPLEFDMLATTLNERLRTRSWTSLCDNAYSIIVYQYGKDESGKNFSDIGYIQKGNFSNDPVFPWIRRYTSPSSRIVNIDVNRMDNGIFNPVSAMADSMTNVSWSSFDSSTDATALPYAGHNNTISVNRADGSAGCINPRGLSKYRVFFFRAESGERIKL